MNTSQKVWFITGGNKGIGAAIVKEALAQGYNVVAASRKTEEAEKNLGSHANLLIVKLDISNDQQVKDAVQAAINKFGRIDVLVNNAGYGLLGYFEEMSEELIRRQIETNLFGTMKVTRAILPIMRAQGAGFVVTVSSTSGIRATPGGSVYSSSKFALEGWSEGMNLDMKQFNIHFMLLEPGPFRTDFADANSSMQVPDLKLKEYQDISQSLADVFDTMNGTQSGDPAKLAKGLIKVVNSDDAPVRLLISKAAMPGIDAYYKNRYAEFEKWQDISADSDFDG